MTFADIEGLGHIVRRPFAHERHRLVDIAKGRDEQERRQAHHRRKRPEQIVALTCLEGGCRRSPRQAAAPSQAAGGFRPVLPPCDMTAFERQRLDERLAHDGIILDQSDHIDPQAAFSMSSFRSGNDKRMTVPVRPASHDLELAAQFITMPLHDPEPKPRPPIQWRGSRTLALQIFADMRRKPASPDR